MRILVVEDSKVLQKTVGTALRRSGFAVDIAGDGEEGLWLARSGDYDALVLDIMLPKMDGIEVLRTLRAEGRQTHVLLLTAKDAVANRVAGLNAGADDYLVKPFELDELIARVQALCRRSYGRKDSGFTLGELGVDFASRTVSLSGKPVELTAREYLLLEYLARRRGEVVSRAEIEAHIYDDRTDLMSNAVDSAVCALRRKITRDGGADPIRTRRGLGYVLGETGREETK